MCWRPSNIPPPSTRAYDVKAQDDEPTDEDLLDWDSDDDEPGLTAPASLPSAGRWDEPRRNPLRHVGRNDPCPCGSGKKQEMLSGRVMRTALALVPRNGKGDA